MQTSVLGKKTVRRVSLKIVISRAQFGSLRRTTVLTLRVVQGYAKVFFVNIKKQRLVIRRHESLGKTKETKKIVLNVFERKLLQVCSPKAKQYYAFLKRAFLLSLSLPRDSLRCRVSGHAVAYTRAWSITPTCPLQPLSSHHRCGLKCQLQPA